MRGALGGTLMGLANLVPGISGGTMLLACGVYPGFVTAIAELTTLRFRLRSLALLASIGGMAVLAIVLLAGPTKTLVVEQRWIMYSLFIGMTLGGVPIVWRLARPATPPVAVGALLGFLVMVAMAFLAPGGGGERSIVLLFLAGTAGAAAMILPGVSGGYLLLVLGQYVVILSAIDGLKEGVLAPLRDGVPFEWAALAGPLGVVVPVGVGVVVGVVGISNLVRWTLDRFPKPTLGVLLGLLVGAVAGLWPFQESVPPAAWSESERSTLAADEPDDWPVRRFDPSAGQVGGAVTLIGLGFAVTSAIGRLGREERD